jgi:methylenetetrahydrofolate reductase (NADPH)
MVTRVSVELVPRSEASLEAELRALCAAFPRLDTVNVPDLLRFPLRSWDACGLARRFVARAIPHLRAMDFEPGRIDGLSEDLARNRIEEVIVVRGDAPQDMARRVFPTRSDELVVALKRRSPELRVYAALDPYRGSFRDELEHVEAKREAGADGLFTQPFFDLRLMDVWADLLPAIPIYWGVTPVTAPSTRRYWETKNHAILPASFAPTLDWSRRFAKEALAWAQERETHVYFMPIRTDPLAYLHGLLASEP